MVIWLYFEDLAVSPVKKTNGQGEQTQKTCKWSTDSETPTSKQFIAGLSPQYLSFQGQTSIKLERNRGWTVAPLLLWHGQRWRVLRHEAPFLKLPKRSPGTCFKEWCDPHIASKPCHKVHAVLQPEQTLEIAVPRNYLGCASRTQTAHATQTQYISHQQIH